MRLIIYLALATLVCFIAGYFTTFDKSYWVGFIVATVLDIVWHAAKVVTED